MILTVKSLAQRLFKIPNPKSQVLDQLQSRRPLLYPDHTDLRHLATSVFTTSLLRSAQFWLRAGVTCCATKTYARLGHIQEIQMKVLWDGFWAPGFLSTSWVVLMHAPCGPLTSGIAFMHIGSPLIFIYSSFTCAERVRESSSLLLPRSALIPQ